MTNNTQEKWEVILAPKGTLLAKFQKDRTDAISAMFDRDVGCGTIHTTSQFFAELDESVRQLLATQAQEIEEAVEGMKKGVPFKVYKVNDLMDESYNLALDDTLTAIKQVTNKY